MTLATFALQLWRGVRLRPCPRAFPDSGPVLWPCPRSFPDPECVRFLGKRWSSSAPRATSTPQSTTTTTSRPTPTNGHRAALRLSQVLPKEAKSEHIICSHFFENVCSGVFSLYDLKTKFVFT